MQKLTITKLKLW